VSGSRERAPVIDRNPVDGFARLFVYFFALMPAGTAIAIAFAAGRLGPLDRVAPLVVLSGLAVVVAAGEQVQIYRERLLSMAWLGLLVAPPVIIVLGIAVLPWTVGADPHPRRSWLSPTSGAELKRHSAAAASLARMRGAGANSSETTT
jgi:hypothetical protein